jgi:hypothetical protein
LRIAHVDQEDAHSKQTITLGLFHNPTPWKFRVPNFGWFNKSNRHEARVRWIPFNRCAQFNPFKKEENTESLSP